jgi:hypothetical protein
MNAEDSPLIKFMRISELGQIVLDLLGPSIGDLTALATTCKIAAACVRQSLVCLPALILAASGRARLTYYTGVLGL